MKNLLKIYILFTLFIFVFIPCVNSFAIDMDLDSYENTTIDSDTTTNETDFYDDLMENDSIDEEEYVEEDIEADTDTNSPTVTTTSSEDDEFLTIENILSIIIIVIGIILIFLAIAILIRCK